MSSFTDPFAARILIVDDQESNLRLLEYALSRSGYVAVGSTNDPKHVVPLHAANDYDLILLDLQMPVMSGFDVLAALRGTAGTNVAVLVLSADPNQMVRALETGADGFLAKPFVITEVLHQVKMLLERGGSGPITPTRDSLPAAA